MVALLIAVLASLSIEAEAHSALPCEQAKDAIVAAAGKADIRVETLPGGGLDLTRRKGIAFFTCGKDGNEPNIGTFMAGSVSAAESRAILADLGATLTGAAANNIAQSLNKSLSEQTPEIVGTAKVYCKSFPRAEGIVCNVSDARLMH